MDQSGIALPATQKDLSIPITPWLPMKWPLWLFIMSYASEQLGMSLGHSPMAQDLLRGTLEGLSQAL